MSIMKNKFSPVWKPHTFVVKYEVHSFEGYTVVNSDSYVVKTTVAGSTEKYLFWEKCTKNAIAANFYKRWHDPLFMNEKFYKGMHIISIEQVL